MAIARVRIESAGYDAETPAIRDVEFTVGPGELVGLIGPNGAGKSTTVKAMMGLLKHCQGEVRIDGARGTYAYVPEQPVFYDELTLWEHLELAAAAAEMSEQQFQRKVFTLLDQFRLRDAIHRYPAAFSKGMQQKMMLIIGFLSEPDLFIVDEPFVGLDPIATKQFQDLLAQERARGAGVVMSTHVLDTAEKICDHFVLIHDGTMIADGTLADMRRISGLDEGSLFDCFHGLIIS